MATPIFLYRNIFRTAGAVITSSGTDSGYDPADIADHRAYRGWQGNVLTSTQWINLDAGAAVSADSILIVNGNMVSNAGQVKVYADTVNPPVAVAQAAYSPTSDTADYKAFGSLNKRYWRVEFIDPAPPFTTKPFAGEILLGTKLTSEEYAAPDVDPFLHDVEAISNRSEGGHYLGAILRGVTRRGTIRLGGTEVGLSRSFYTSDMTDFLRNHYRKLLPFGFVLDSADSDLSRAFWVKKPDDHKSPLSPIGRTYNRFAVDLAIEEAIMEAA
jgi:hypothetical protein